MSRYRPAKETGDLFGLSVKALRVYEDRGLISPGRSPAGWRVYGPAEVAALHKITALKSIGFSLADIASLLKGGVSVDEVLAAQADSLSARRDGLALALAVVERARARLRAGEALSTDDLIDLAQETIMSDDVWTDAHQALAEKHYTPEQMKALRARKLSPEMQATVFTQWQALIDEAERLREGPPDAPEALDLAKRWRVLAGTFTQGDPKLSAATAAWYKDGFSNPETAKLMPFSKEVWDFMAKAQAALDAAEGA